MLAGYSKTGLGKCTHQGNKMQGNNTRALPVPTKKIFFRCKKRDRQQKKRTDKKELMYKNVKTIVCLSSYTLRRWLLLKALVYYCFLVFCHIGEYISLDLFCFVNLTSSLFTHVFAGVFIHAGKTNLTGNNENGCQNWYRYHYCYW